MGRFFYKKYVIIKNNKTLKMPKEKEESIKKLRSYISKENASVKKYIRDGLLISEIKDKDGNYFRETRKLNIDSINLVVGKPLTEGNFDTMFSVSELIEINFEGVVKRHTNKEGSKAVAEKYFDSELVERSYYREDETLKQCVELHKNGQPKTITIYDEKGKRKQARSFDIHNNLNLDTIFNENGRIKSRVEHERFYNKGGFYVGAKRREVFSENGDLKEISFYKKGILEEKLIFKDGVSYKDIKDPGSINKPFTRETYNKSGDKLLKKETGYHIEIPAMNEETKKGFSILGDASLYFDEVCRYTDNKLKTRSVIERPYEDYTVVSEGLLFDEEDNLLQKMKYSKDGIVSERLYFDENQKVVGKRVYETDGDSVLYSYNEDGKISKETKFCPNGNEEKTKIYGKDGVLVIKISNSYNEENMLVEVEKIKYASDGRMLSKNLRFINEEGCEVEKKEYFSKETIILSTETKHDAKSKQMISSTSFDYENGLPIREETKNYDENQNIRLIEINIGKGGNLERSERHWLDSSGELEKTKIKEKNSAGEFVTIVDSDSDEHIKDFLENLKDKEELKLKGKREKKTRDRGKEPKNN